MRPSGNKTALLLLSGLLCTCVHLPPHDPFLWDEDAPVVKAQRVDVLEAEAVVIRYLRSLGWFSAPASTCDGSARAYELLTSETPEAYQVVIIENPNLCDVPPDVEVDPPGALRGEGPTEYAVSKKDLHIIRKRFRGDEFKAAWKESRKQEARKESLEFLDAGYPPEPNRCSAALERMYPDGGFPKDGVLIRRSDFPDCFHDVEMPAGWLPHKFVKKEKPQRDGGVEGCPCECRCDGGCKEGSPVAPGAPRAPDGGAPPAGSPPLRSSPDGGSGR